MNMKEPDALEYFHTMREAQIWIPLKSSLEVLPELTHDIIEEYGPFDTLHVVLHGLTHTVVHVHLSVGVVRGYILVRVM